MAANGIIIRVQSAELGTHRIQTKPTERTQEFLQKVKKEFDLSGNNFKVFLSRDKSSELKASKSKTLSSLKLRHGDMVYLESTSSDVSMADSSASLTRPLSAASSVSVKETKPKHVQPSEVVEDEVDQILYKEDGRIFRERNEQFCRHGPSGKCVHCVPLEPYDEQYLQSVDPPIKFLSFHSYIRKLTGGADKGKFVSLENLSCKIKPGCKGHPPWPGGICTKCQPNAVTLNRQKYRHVDYIQFENPFLVEKFLNYWRNTGNQRIGYLYGRYEPHQDSPLGLKAVVAAIYEPSQIDTKHSVELLDDDRAHTVDNLASQLGLRKVGWIFTDLVAQDLKKGTVKHFRGNINSHFLSAEECIMAADFQNKHPNPCKLSPDGHFGSKFVSVVVSGDASNQIHFDGYQVSDQCMALVNDNCLVPTRDAPELGYVKESTNEQYVPDVFYKEIDTYRNEVTRLARPLPVEYLLVDLPAAFPVEPKFTFHAGNSVKPFPVENRASLGEVQDFNAFSQYMQQFKADKFLESVSDFHLLIYMATCDMLPLKDHIASLLEAVKTQDEELARHWSKTEEWATVEQLMAANTPSPPTSRQTSYAGGGAVAAASASASSDAMWTCAHCTFLNSSNTSTCEMCSLPK